MFVACCTFFSLAKIEFYFTSKHVLFSCTCRSEAQTSGNCVKQRITNQLSRVTCNRIRHLARSGYVVTGFDFGQSFKNIYL